MKKIFLLLIACGLLSLTTFSQVGIGTTTPDGSAMLEVKSTAKGILVPRMTSAQRVAIATPAEGLKVYDTDTKTFWFYNGSGWVQTNYWTPNGINIFNNNSGNVGIGTSTPADKLTVKTFSNNFGLSQTDGTVTVGTYISSGIGWLGTKSNHPLSFYTNNSGQQMTLITNGNFGIGTTVPDYRLTVSSNLIAGNTNTNLLKLTGQNPLMSFSNGSTDFGYIKAWTFQPYAPFTNGLVIGSAPGYPIYFSTNNYSASMEVADNGNIGIGITSPSNKLQIGSMGAVGFNGNDLAIGNGTNATGFFQSASNLQVYSSTNIALMPKSGTGRVGINTLTPRAPLDIADYVGIYESLGYSYLNVGSSVGGVGGCNPCTSSASVYVSNAVLAAEFDAFSDARIKNITGVSDNWKDLETLNALRITDYTMKDKVKYGNKPFKKVIAQQVEKVYPQVVSKHTDFIPNVYQLASMVEKAPNGYRLHFDNNHNISSAAKKLRLLLSDKDGMQQFNIVAIPDDKDVIIEATDLKADKIFVYGEEVNDFRTVDYEGLTTLNISATQELSKQLKKQQAIIELLEKRLLALEAKNK
jgi:hypothetical protein